MITHPVLSGARQVVTLARRRCRCASLSVAGILLALAGVTALSGCARAGGRAAATRVTVAGSTSVTPFAEQLAEEFMRKRPGVQVNIQGIGSSAGIQATETGAADVGMSSRALNQEEVRELHPVLVALDAMAIIAHPDNPVRNVALPQLRRIFAGEIRNWRMLGGRDAPITLVNREAGSGARGAFEELVMGKGGSPLDYRSIRQGSQGAVRAVVEGDPNAVGYVSSGVLTPGVRALHVDGVAPTAEEAVAGRYKLVRPFLFVLRRGEAPVGLARDYIGYVLSKEGQETLVHSGLIAAPKEALPWKD
ncbi:MAG: phosphate ABC transporter substrate-binding protein [Armatimonadetes bacterium]|nr:phosphate ABC transporter substrate-binding protein [Armatimonadota bacterium]